MKTKLLRKLRKTVSIYKADNYFILRYIEYKRIVDTTIVVKRIKEMSYANFYDALINAHTRIKMTSLYSILMNKKHRYTLKKSKIYP